MDETVGLNGIQGPDDAGEISLATGEEADMLPDDYYRSQKEVDAAFKKRLEREKQRWELAASEEAEMQMQDYLKENADAAQDGESGWDEEAFLDAIQSEAEVITGEDPDFDLAAEMEKNPVFALMLAQGLPLKRVYDFFHNDAAEGRLKKAVEQDIISRIRSRNSRPAPIGLGSGEARRDISRMSDAEILEIDARVRRGERIVL